MVQSFSDTLYFPSSQCNVVQNSDSWYTELCYKKQQEAQERDQEIILHLVYIMMFNKNLSQYSMKLPPL